jgi:D12 class N6 adenine-specific DNA methyltransferase
LQSGFMQKKRTLAFSYPGSKARIAKRICELLPPSGDRFVDVFAGRGNVTFAVMAVLSYERFWINDSGTDPFFRTLKVGFPADRLPARGKENYKRHKEMMLHHTLNGKWIPAGVPASVAAEPLLTFSGGGYAHAGPRAGDDSRGGPSSAGYRGTVRRAMELMRSRNVTITSLDYREVLVQLGPDDVAYIDPPYLNAKVQTYSERTIDYPALVKSLRNACFRWVLSEYEQPIYVEAFGEPAMRIKVKRVMTDASKEGRRKSAVECLWTNA